MWAHGCHSLSERRQGRRKNAMRPLVLWQTRDAAEDKDQLSGEPSSARVHPRPPKGCVAAQIVSGFKDVRHPQPAARPSIAPLPRLASCSTRSRPDDVKKQRRPGTTKLGGGSPRHGHDRGAVCVDAGTNNSSWWHYMHSSRSISSSSCPSTSTCQQPSYL
jgi:hypothetical protein